MRLLHVHPYLDDTPGEIHVLPAQSEQSAFSHTGAERQQVQSVEAATAHGVAILNALHTLFIGGRLYADLG